MAEAIKPADLLIDEENPRIPNPNAGQRLAIQALAQFQGRKLQVLAKDIVDHGLNPAELPIVMPVEGGPQRYRVLEGNRRLAALRALENPELLVDVVRPGVLKEFRKLSHDYQSNPIELVECFVVADRDEAEHWIELRHTGEKGGAGLVTWGSDESARFRARSGKLEVHQQALDFLERCGELTVQERAAVPSTSFRRLLGTPEVRAKLGVEVQGGRLYMLAPEKKVAAALLHITDDLASGKTKVRDIYRKHQRVAYANALPSAIAVTPTKKSGKGKDISTGEPQPATRRAPSPKLPKTRDKLIPSDCVLSVSDPRCKEIETELRRLNLEKFPNAVSVLFRVFFELGVDTYIERVNLQKATDSTLRNKTQAVITHLTNQRKLTRQQAKPVRRAIQRDSFLAASVDVMHDYVHNQYVFPGPSDLRAGWSSLQPFMTAMWAE